VVICPFLTRCVATASVCCNRTSPLSSITIPVLELHGNAVNLKDVSADGVDGRDTNTPAEAADLPTGFRELWLRVNHINVETTRHAGGAPVSGIDIAEELCWFLALAPDCYRAFRLYEYRDECWYYTSVSVPYISLSLLGSNGVSSCTGKFDSLQDMAAAMQRFEDAHGFIVSTSADQTHLLVVRVES